MKIFILLFSILFTYDAFSQGEAPALLRGQSQTTNQVGSFIQVPLSQITRLGSATALIETGNENIIANPGFEANNVNGWATYADASQSTPVDATGGSPVVTFATTSTTPLSGLRSALLTKDNADRQGQGVSYAFTLNRRDRNQLIDISFDYEIASGTYASGDVGVFVYDVTNSALITPIVVDMPTTSSNIRFNTSFQASSSTSYRLIFHVRTASTNPYTVEIDNVVVQPSKSFVGSVVTDWQSYTPTFNGFGSPTSIEMQWRRNGSNVEIRGKFVTGTTTAAEARVGLPLGLNSASTTSIPSIQVSGVYGIGSNATVHGGFILMEPSVSYITFGQVQAFSGTSGQSLTKQNASGIAQVVNETISLNASIPIAGWSASQTVYNQNCNTDTECTDTFSAKVNSSGTVSGENVDWISGNCSYSSGVATCTFNSGVFTVAPNCTAISQLSTNTATTMQNSAPSSSSVAFLTRDSNSGSPINRDIHIICQKQGADYRARRTILGVFRDHVRTNGVERPVMYSAKISSSGTVSDETGDWINGNASVSGTSSNRKTITFNSGIFSSTPNCTVTSESPSCEAANCVQIASIFSVSSSQLVTVGLNIGNVYTAHNIQVICHGAAP